MMTEREVVTLKEYVDTRLADAERALVQARESMSQRLDGMNHLQAQLNRQADLYLSKAEMKSWIEHVDIDLRDLRESKAALAGKASSTSANLATGIAICGTLIGIAALIVSVIT